MIKHWFGILTTDKNSMKERHPSSWHNMIFFHDQDHHFDNDQFATYKAGHVRLKHSQEIA